MTDDFAIDGQEAGYVPCEEAASVLVVEEEGAISGIGTGYVAKDQAASSLPAPERAAIVGSAVGYVAKPCVEGCPVNPWDSFNTRETYGTNPASWGVTSRDAIPWQIVRLPSGVPVPGPGPLGYAWVEAGRGILRAPPSATLSLAAARVSSGPAIGGTDFTMCCRFQIPWRITDLQVTEAFIGFAVRLVGTSTWLARTLGRCTEDPGNTHFTSVPPAVWCRAKLEADFTAREYRLKTWVEADGEPGSWGEILSWGAGDHVASQFYVYAETSINVSTPSHGEVHFDCIDFSPGCTW